MNTQRATRMALPLIMLLAGVALGCASSYLVLKPGTTTVTLFATTALYSTVTVTATAAVAEKQLVVVLERPEHYWGSVFDFNGDGVGDVLVEVNPWNLEKYSGVMKVVVDLGKRTIAAEFDVHDAAPAAWVNGYPEVIIGRKPWSNVSASGFGIEFPVKVSNMKPFVLSFYICIEELHPSVAFNIAADAWIVRREVAANPGMPPGGGDLEVMVWLFSQNLQPAGRKVGEEVIPLVVNGSRISAVFEVWRHDSVEWGGWQYIAFKPKDWSVRCGYVAYDPTVFVKAAGKYATLDISSHYLLGWEIGTEWGTILSNGTAKFKWILRDLAAIPSATVS